MRGERYRNAARRALLSEAFAQFAIGGNAAGYEDAAGAELFMRGEGFSEQIPNNGVLKAGNEVQGRLRAKREGSFARFWRVQVAQHARGARGGFFAHTVQLNVAQNGCLDS